MKKRRNWSRKLSTKTKFDCEESRKKFVAQSRLVFAAALSMTGGKEYRFQREYLGFQVAELCRRDHCIYFDRTEIPASNCIYFATSCRHQKAQNLNFLISVKGTILRLRSYCPL